MKNILIIGANSYIGKSFADYIIKNKIQMKITLVSASNNEWVEMDFSPYHSVIILSALVHQKEKKSMEEQYFAINCDLPVEITKKAKAAGVSQVIFFSTAAVYGSNVTCISKKTIPSPNTLYGKSKFKGECEIQKLQTVNFGISIIRPPMVYGENCPGNYARLVKFARVCPIYPDIHNRRSRVHIETLCNFLLDIIENGRTGVFEPQDDQYGDTIQIIKKIRSCMNRKTILVPGCRTIMKFCIKHNSVLKKVFGDLYIEKENKHGL